MYTKAKEKHIMRRAGEHMKILVSGGGTAGHITPILSVARELKRRHPAAQIIFVGEKGGRFTKLIEKEPTIDDYLLVHAGKFRRYHGEHWVRRLFDVKTHALNVRDAFFVMMGFFESRRIVKRERPDVVFLKGGFVGAPLGAAAGMANIPLVAHDSDTIAGLANRLVRRWVSIHAVAGAPENYPYDSERVRMVGVIISDDYKAPVDDKYVNACKEELSIPSDATLLFVTGGSSGSVAVNSMMDHTANQLLENYDNLHIIHQSGRGKAGASVSATVQERYRSVDFIDNMHVVSAAADVIVMRAGANTLAEFGAQGKACIVIPAPHLTGGHQLKNAEYLAKKEAVVAIDQAEAESDPDVLRRQIELLLDDASLRQGYGRRLREYTVTDADVRIADIIERLIEANDEEKDR